MLLPKCYKTEMSKITIDKNNNVQGMTFLVEITQGWHRLRIISTCCWKARGWMADTKTITLSIVSAIFVWIWWKTVESILCTPSDPGRPINENQEELATRKKELVEENSWGTGDHEEGGGALAEVEEAAAGKGVGSQFLQTKCLRKQYYYELILKIV